MSFKRVQKLLFSEYSDFEDMVLIESPFAQTTKDGHGVRQVHIGLTPTKLVLATDVLPPVERSSVDYLPGIDPDIETFELIAIYPIECVNLSVYRRHKRQAIKAHFCNNKVFYFELGGFENRTMLWNLWCEKVKFLAPDYETSQSETSVATSSTNSTLYLIERKQVDKPNGSKQIWCKFGTEQDSKFKPKWTDRYLFATSSDFKYQPAMTTPRFTDFLHKSNAYRQVSNYSVSHSMKPVRSLAREVHIGDSYLINRFSDGVHEGCSRPLFLPAENYIVPQRYSQYSDQSLELIRNETTPQQVQEEAVKQWEENHKTRRQSRIRHRRRYGFTPKPLFLNGLGPWNVDSGCQYSIQIKRAVSVITIRRQAKESEMRLSIAKRQLASTISAEAIKANRNEVQSGLGRPNLIFWTPNYWYRPRSARDNYLELRRHLNMIHEYKQKTKKKRTLFRRRASLVSKMGSSDSDLTDLRSLSKNANNRNRKKSLALILSGKHRTGAGDSDIKKLQKKDKETYLEYLDRVLQIDIVLTGWDFNSNLLAEQITMVDRDLFLKVSTNEFGILIKQKSSKNTPNLGAVIAFSHRLSCLVTTDVLKNECERMRARMIARFINVAAKCHKICNFHSCRTILYGLQCPAIYRLKGTWAYVRKKHASKYRNFESLSKLYRDPRLLSYQKNFILFAHNTPHLPYIGDLIAKLFDRLPTYTRNNLPTKPPQLTERSDSLFNKLISSVRLLNFNDQTEEQTQQKGLCDYFTPLNRYEDNRDVCLDETVHFLQKCQLSVLHYNYRINDIAMNYLLKARYKEEKENFFDSIRIE